MLNTWATFIYFFSQWVLTVLIARISGFDDSGNFTLAVSFTNIFGFISRFGMRSVQVSDVNGEYENGVYFTSRIITSISSIIPFAIVLLICQYRKELSLCCIAMMVYKLLESFDDLNTGMFQKTDRFNNIAVSYTAKAVLTFSIFTLHICSHVELHNCILAMAAAYSVVLVFYDAAILNRMNFFKISFKDIKKLLIVCVPLIGVSLLDTVLIYLPRNAVEKIYGATQLGYYGAVSIVVVVLSTLAGAIWGSVMPLISKRIKVGEWRELRQDLKKISLFLFAGGLLVFVLGEVLGPMFYKALYGNEILQHMDLLPYVLANSIFLLYNSFFQCVFVPLGKRNVLFFSDLSATIICILIIKKWTIAFGIAGASCALGVALAVRFIILGLFCKITIQRVEETIG